MAHQIRDHTACTPGDSSEAMDQDFPITFDRLPDELDCLRKVRVDWLFRVVVDFENLHVLNGGVDEGGFTTKAEHVSDFLVLKKRGVSSCSETSKPDIVSHALVALIRDPTGFITS